MRQPTPFTTGARLVEDEVLEGVALRFSEVVEEVASVLRAYLVEGLRGRRVSLTKATTDSLFTPLGAI